MLEDLLASPKLYIVWSPIPDMSLRSNRKQELGQRSASKKHVTLMSFTLESTVWSRDTG